MKTETRPVELRNIYRFGAFVLAVAVGVTSLSARMFYLQVVRGQQADQGANVALTATQNVPSTRGLIYDASGAPLVKNVVTYSVTVTPIDLNLSQKPLVAERLGSLLSTNPVDIETRIDSASGSLYDPVKIADNVPVEVARFIEENSDSLPGVKVVVIQHRQYVTGPLFSEILGYTGQITQAQYDSLKSQGYSNSDVVGQNGLEASYEQLLRGTYGDESVALDDSGKAIPGLVTGHKPPIPGESLTLTIDTHEQEIAQKALQWGLNGSGVPIATRGVIIVENPQNGNILAMVSLPSYDDQKFADGISATDFQKLLADPSQPLLNKAIADQYAPGSTFKLVTGTAGLQDDPQCSFAGDKVRDGFDYCSGTFNASTTLLSQPYIQIGDFKFWEWDKQGWGPLNITQGVAYSSDTFFYQLAQMVGLDRLTFWATQYGFGAPTGIDLPFEASGIVPTNDWKEKNTGLPMYTGEILQAGIGQGYDAATPLQLLNAYCALANGGNLWQPHVVESTTDSTGNITPIQPKLLNKLPASQETLQQMRLATRAVVTTRHTYNLVDLPIKVAGKTGTAEFGVNDKYGRLPYHEWFVGYVPGDPYNGDFTKPDSQLAVMAFIYGADTWGNVATEVVKYYLMMHFGLKGDPFNIRTPGYIQTWTQRVTNFYGSPNRD
ncbi:MAG TPA: penicillin-binding protein 2 [Candidatus Limnocylindrales bacterium]|nr:penicillin-binding protein 2 [Candidatus Limnocylindrales bacterium]